MNREKWLKSIKFALASVIAIGLADLLGLKYATTAGIITILSIQNTKKETLKVAARRAAAFVCSLFVAGICFGIFGFTIAGFAAFLLGFSAICLYLGWPEALSMCAVLAAHFLTEQNMGSAALLNETLLFVIGAGMGILANLHLHSKTAEFDQLAKQADHCMREALTAVTAQLTRQSTKRNTVEKLEVLQDSLSRLQECAHRNWNNTLWAPSGYETDYADMRSGQAVVLQHICESAAMLELIPGQAKMVAGLLEEIEQEYRRSNPVEGLLEKLRNMYEQMRQEPLPVSREEFEARAVLFYVLKQIEAFLNYKRSFALKYKLK